MVQKAFMRNSESNANLSWHCGGKVIKPKEFLEIFNSILFSSDHFLFKDLTTYMEVSMNYII